MGMQPRPVRGAATGSAGDPWRYHVLDLRKQAGWKELAELLSGDRLDAGGQQAHEAAQAIIEILRSLGVRAAVVESPYTDADFSAEFLAFHARQFRIGSKDCRRVHFFHNPPEDLQQILTPEVKDEGRRRGQLAGLVGNTPQDSSYRGFCVLRPTPDVPIGYTVVAMPTERWRLERKLRALYSAHILGQEFQVYGFPFMEQDSRTGACAQAALWMALRHIWAAEGGAWRTVPSLNAVATLEADETSSSSVPPGSGGLHAGNILRALRNAERIPHYFSAVPALQEGRFVVRWKSDVDPMALACRYLDSEIPVIVLLGRTASRPHADTGAPDTTYDPLEVQDGHAVTAIGYYGDPTKAPFAVRRDDDHLHLAQWVDGLLVQNDQTGPYNKLPRVPDSGPPNPNSFVAYSCADILGLIVPLPDEVFLRADKAEEYAWIFVAEMADEWWQLFTSESSNGPPAPLDTKRLAVRTFLTRGYNHYQWLAKVKADPDVLNLAATLHHPRYIWITEFYSLEGEGPDTEWVVAHVVADATAAASDSAGTSAYNAFLFGHLPGRCYARFDEDAGFVLKRLSNDKAYRSFEHQDVR